METKIDCSQWTRNNLHRPNKGMKITNTSHVKLLCDIDVLCFITSYLKIGVFVLNLFKVLKCVKIMSRERTKIVKKHPASLAQQCISPTATDLCLFSQNYNDCTSSSVLYHHHETYT